MSTSAAVTTSGRELSTPRMWNCASLSSANMGLRKVGAQSSADVGPLSIAKHVDKVQIGRHQRLNRAIEHQRFNRTAPVAQGFARPRQVDSPLMHAQSLSAKMHLRQIHQSLGVGRAKELTHLDWTRLAIFLALPAEPCHVFEASIGPPQTSRKLWYHCPPKLSSWSSCPMGYYSQIEWGMYTWWNQARSFAFQAPPSPQHGETSSLWSSQTQVVPDSPTTTTKAASSLNICVELFFCFPNLVSNVTGINVNQTGGFMEAESP